MGKGSRGRPRKIGVKRYKSGKVADPTTQAEREERTYDGPTAQMKLYKAEYSCDWSDPVAVMAEKEIITAQQGEALSWYRECVSACLAGAPSRKITGSLSERIQGDSPPEFDDDADMRVARRRKEALAALEQAGQVSVDAVHSLIMSHGYHHRPDATVEAIRRGADALVAHFRHGQRRAA